MPTEKILNKSQQEWIINNSLTKLKSKLKQIVIQSSENCLIVIPISIKNN